MADEIQKFLNKLNTKENIVVADTIEKIIMNKLEGLDVTKISGKENLFRVRKGKYRILFLRGNKSNTIIKAEKRSDNTYNL